MPDGELSYPSALPDRGVRTPNNDNYDIRTRGSGIGGSAAFDMEVAKFLRAVSVNNAVSAGELTLGAVRKNDVGLESGGEEVVGQPVGKLVVSETNRRGQCTACGAVGGDVSATSGCAMGGDSSDGPEANDGGDHGR